MEKGLKAARRALVGTLRKIPAKMLEEETEIAAEAVRDFLYEGGWCYNESEEGGFVIFECYKQSEKHEQPAFCALMIVRQSVVMFRVYVPLKIPQERMGEIAEYVARANDHEFFSTFILDYEKQLVYLRGVVDLEDRECEPIDVVS